MKNLLFILVLVLVNASCNDQSEIINNRESGRILLRIDRANAPSSVVYVAATLSRDGYSPITATLNLLSDSTADLLLENIQAGIWHLKVDAMNDSMVVLYTGETDITILAGFTTPVNLTLHPTGQGTGSIYIYVSWGGTPTNFTYVDNLSNPVLSGGNNSYDYYGIAQPVILYDEGKYKMWYYGDGGSAKKYVLYAESQNGINWKRHPYPVLLPSSNGWDSWAVHPAAVLKEDNIYKMYFNGFSNQNGPWYVGLATSVDGINWVKKPNPVFYSGTGWETLVAAGSVVKINDKYHLYYTGRDIPYYRIGLAISDDGENFTRYSVNPILTFDKTWENLGILSPHVYQENNIYKMVYMNSNNTAFGLASSSDGKLWTKESTNPIFSVNQTSNGWADVSIAYPRYIKVGNEVRFYYSGSKNPPPNVYHKIGFFKRIN